MKYRTERREKRKMYYSWLLMALLVAFGSLQLSCRKKPPEGAVDHIQSLEGIFNFRWPSTYSNDFGAEWNYHAHLDRDSDNKVYVARFETDSTTYATWRASLNTNFTVFPRWIPYRNDQLSDEFFWWDVHQYSENQLTRFSAKIETNQNYTASLDIDVAATNQHYVFYVNASLLKRK